MKIRKLAGLLLATAVAAAAMMPAASAAPADFGLIATEEDDIRYTNGQCEASLNNGPELQSPKGGFLI